MSSIGTVSSGMAQAMTMKPPPGPPSILSPSVKSSTDSDADVDGSGSVPNASSAGKRVNIAA